MTNQIPLPDGWGELVRETHGDNHLIDSESTEPGQRTENYGERIYQCDVNGEAFEPTSENSVCTNRSTDVGKTDSSQTTLNTVAQLPKKNKHKRATKHTCDCCGKKCLSSHGLANHRKIHLPRSTLIYGCTYCRKRFHSMAKLMIHRRIHPSDYKCEKCGDLFYSINQLRIHSRRKGLPCMAVDPSSTGPTNHHKCNICGMRISSKHHLKRHVMSHSYVFKCGVCHIAFASRESLKRHFGLSGSCSDKQNFEIVKKEQYQTPLRYSCPSCYKGFSQKVGLMKHKIRMHTSTAESLVCEFCSKVFENVSAHVYHVSVHVDERMHVCDICGKTVRNLKKHRELHFEEKDTPKEKKYMCDVCGASFCSSSGLRHHSKTNHSGSKTHLCDICGKGYVSDHALQRHKMLHSGERPHACVSCGKTFTTQWLLSRHAKTHFGRERSHKCEVCGKTYLSRSALSTHKISKHADKKQYACLQCGKDFFLKAALQLHMNVHSGKRPFKCEVCGKDFTQPASLNRHKLTHSGEKPHSCDICGLKFNQKCSLTRHERLHTGDKPFKCDLCGMTFTQGSSLTGHKKVHHPN